MVLMLPLSPPHATGGGGYTWWTAYVLPVTFWVSIGMKADAHAVANRFPSNLARQPMSRTGRHLADLILVICAVGASLHDRPLSLIWGTLSSGVVHLESPKHCECEQLTLDHLTSGGNSLLFVGFAHAIAYFLKRAIMADKKLESRTPP